MNEEKEFDWDSQEKPASDDNTETNETPETGDAEQYSEREKGLYARLKKEESRNKELSEKLNTFISSAEESKKDSSAKETVEPKESKTPSLIEQAKEFQAIKDLDDKQLGYVEMISKASGKTLSEVTTSDEFQLWNSAYTAKVEEEQKIPNPSSKQPSDSDADIASLTAAEVLALPPLDERRERWNKLQMQKFKS